MSGDVDVLLRHRAVLLGLVGMSLIVAAFVRSLRVTATAVVVVSTASFIVVAMIGDTSTSELHRVVGIAIAAMGMLTVAALVEIRRLVRRSGP